MYKLLNGIDFYSAQEVDDNFSNESIIKERERAVAAEEQLQTNIVAEVTRATEAETQLQNNIDTEKTRAEAAENTIQTNLDNEVKRATGAEWQLQSNIGNEQIRAEAAEQQLQANITQNNADIYAKIDENKTAIAENKAAIEAEVVRATAAEEAETQRATLAEQANADAIAAEALRAQETERNINNALLSESKRAQEKEIEIDKKLSDEITRATAAEAELNNLIEAEETRATQAEEQLQNNIDAEELRATTAEEANTAAIEAEVVRATAAEEANTQAIESEVTRATEAETQLQNNIDAEEARATAAEEANTQAIENEVTRATQEETAIKQLIADEELRASGAEANLTNSITNVSTRVTNLNKEVDTNRSQQILAFETEADLPATNYDDATKTSIVNNQLAFVKDTQVWRKATTTATQGDPVTWNEFNMPMATDKLEDYPYVVNPKPGQYRWLRFDPNNRNGVVIQKGVVINLSYFSVDKTLHINEDKKFDMGTLNAGMEYNVVMTYDDVSNSINLTAKTLGDTQETDIVVGWFSTLCADVGTTYCRVRFPIGYATQPGITPGVTKYLVQSYDKDTDPDFYNFYNKTVNTYDTSVGGCGGVQALNNYTVCDVDHPLNGFVAGNILPESIWCDTWRPSSPRPSTDRPDALVYCASSGTAIDVYLQSSNACTTQSKFGNMLTTTRTAQLHAMDMADVHKRLLRDSEFFFAALGSNENTNITGSTAPGSSGGHVDTAGRRMISAIGCEDMCGALWQWLDEVAAAGTNCIKDDSTTNELTNKADTDAKFGQNYYMPYVILAGGSFLSYNTNITICGSASRYSERLRSQAFDSHGARGACDVVRGRA